MSGPASPDRVLLSYEMPDGTSGMVQVDASVSEQHTITAQVTEHPVENGPDVADHIRPLPRRVVLSGIVTNTPIYTPATQVRGATGSFAGQFSVQVGNKSIKYTALQFSDEFDRVRDVYGELVTAALGGALFEVTTTLAQYENMAITNFDVPRGAGTGNALQFQIQFQEVRLVDTQQVTALPPSKKIAPKHVGAKPTKDATEDQKTVGQSAAHKLLGGTAGVNLFGAL
jgi:hypothetical protein